MRLPALLAAAAVFAGCSCDSATSTARPLIDVTPPAIDFGAHVGGTTATEPLLLRNEGSAQLVIAAVRIEADARGAFAVGAVPQTLEAGASAAIDVLYRAPAASGVDGAVLVIASDATNAPEVHVSLGGSSTTACRPTERDCGGACVDLASDLRHCGKCGNPCAANQTCVSGACECVKTTCAAQGVNCGTVPDGCGGSLACGTCSAFESCGGGGKPGVCGCTKTTCAAKGKNCGTIADGCGGTLDCGACSGTDSCGGGGTANVCGCSKKPCAAFAGQCGSFGDGCGGTLTCTCGTGQVCDASNLCCTPKTCAAFAGKCGPFADGCGGTLSCSCGTGQVCGGATAGQCCTPKTCAALPGQCGTLSDGCGGTLTCSCGTNQVCGGATAGQCCTPKTCAAFPGQCGSLSDGCGGTLTCGCAGPATCSAAPVGTCCVKKTCADFPGKCGALSDGCGGTLDCGGCPVLGETCGGGGVANACGVPAPVSGRICNVDRWCWENPWPTANTVSALWSASRSEVYLAGNGGTLARFDGTSWTGKDGTTTWFMDVWSPASGEAYASGSYAEVQHYLNGSWSTVTLAPNPGTVSGVHGLSPTDVWFASERTTWRYNGAVSSTYAVNVSYGGLNHLLLLSPTDGWAVGGYGSVVQRFDGSKWVDGRYGASLPDYVSDVWAFGPNDVIIVGNSSGTAQISRFDGTSWATPFLRYYPDLSRPNAVWGANRDDVWVAADNGRLIRWTGSAWSDVTNPLSTSSSSYAAVTGSSTSDVWFATTRGELVYWNGSAFAVKSRSLPPSRFMAVWGATDDDVWIGGDSSTLYHYDGAGFTAVPLVGAGTYISGIWGSAARDVWAVGSGKLFHYDGSAWTAVPAPINPIDHIHGSAQNDVWVMGNNQAAHFTGTAWTVFTVNGTKTMRAIHSFGPNEAVAVGDGGVAMRWNGAAWSAWATVGTQALYSVWGAGPKDLWVGGNYNGVSGATAKVWHYDGASWTQFDTLLGTYINGIAGRASNDVTFVGDRGAMLRWDGSGLRIVSTEASPQLSAITTTGASQWLVGAGATIKRRYP